MPRSHTDSAGTSALVRTLGDLDPDVRLGAVNALAKIGQRGDRSVLVPLISRVSDEKTEVFLREIREGWTRFVQSLPRDPVERGDLREVLALCEQWVRAAKAFQTGELAHHTIVAKRP